MPYKQSTFSPIANKVFHIEHVRELAELLFEEFNRKKQADNQGIDFSVKCYDNTSFISDDLSLFETKSPILKKRIRSIEMVMYPEKGSCVKVGLFHGSDYDTVAKEYNNGSYMEIGAADSMWVNGFYGKLQEWLDGVPDQINPIEKYLKLIVWLGAFTGMYLFGVIVDLFNINKTGYIPYWENVFTGFDVFAYILIAAIFGGLFGAGIISTQTQKSPDIWPIVELQTGPDHLMKEKIKRNFLYIVWSMIILPLILSIASSIIWLAL